MERLGIGEGSMLAVIVGDDSSTLIPVRDPFELALHGRKYARIRAEDLERWSEEWQEKVLGL